jgi:hypothetical protein
VTETATPTPSRTRTPTSTPTFAFPPPIEGARGTIDADCNYKVAVGDRLFRIGVRFNRTLRELIDANGLTDASIIRPEQVLKIPNCLEPLPTATSSGTLAR